MAGYLVSNLWPASLESQQKEHPQYLAESGDHPVATQISVLPEAVVITAGGSPSGLQVQDSSGMVSVSSTDNYLSQTHNEIPFDQLPNNESTKLFLKLPD